LSFDGAEIEALPGETIAAALAAADIVAVRRARSGAPRGPYCGMGVCFDLLGGLRRLCRRSVAPRSNGILPGATLVRQARWLAGVRP